MMNPSGLKLSTNAARLIGLNEYLDSFPGEKLTENWYDRDK